MFLCGVNPKIVRVLAAFHKEANGGEIQHGTFDSYASTDSIESDAIWTRWVATRHTAGRTSSIGASQALDLEPDALWRR
jgi:hypothetical protein